MAPRAVVPSELTAAPFTLAEARGAGVTRYQLRSRAWKRVGPSTYVWAGLRVEPMLQILAAGRRLPPNAAFSGLTAAWLHGLDAEPCDPIEVTVPHSGGISAREGLRVSRAVLEPGEVALRRRVRVTTVDRTLFDLSRHLPLVEAVVVTDMALHRRLIDLVRLQLSVTSWQGRPGVRRFRKVLELATPGAESAMETRLRLLLIQHGLPDPEVQARLCDGGGRFLARVDLYYPIAGLVIEYDGEGHRETLAEDNRRQNALLAAGFALLRVTASDLRRPGVLVAQVKAALAGSGALHEPLIRPSTGQRAFRGALREA